MFYTYLLQSIKNKRLYTGITSDLRRRFKEHNDKRGGAYTSRNAPFDLIFYEAFIDKKDATEAELFFKSGYGREVLRDKLKNYLGKNK
ncbi:MAG: GIY-YIG nuclease family protein [Patescibacteria group bacterium]